MNYSEAELNEISYKVRGAIFEVFKQLGPGLLEFVYRKALVMELELMGLEVEEEVEVEVFYKRKSLGFGYRADIVVAGAIIIEVKSVAELHPVDFKQLMNYLRLFGAKLGFLVNFNVAFLEDKKSLVRIIV